MLAYMQLMMIAVDIISSNGLHCLPSFAYKNVIQISERLSWMALCSVFKTLLHCSLERGPLLQTGFESLPTSSGNMGRFCGSPRQTLFLSGNIALSNGGPWKISCVWADLINCEVFFILWLLILIHIILTGIFWISLNSEKKAQFLLLIFKNPIITLYSCLAIRIYQAFSHILTHS